MADHPVLNITPSGFDRASNVWSGDTSGGDTIPVGDDVALCYANIFPIAIRCRAAITLEVAAEYGGGLAVNPPYVEVTGGAGIFIEFGPFPAWLFDNGVGRVDITWPDGGAPVCVAKRVAAPKAWLL